MKTTINKKTVLLLLSIALLGACSPDDESSATNQGEGQNATSQAAPSDEIAGQLSTTYYPAVIQDGQYDLSHSRGNVVNSTSQANLRNFEVGLYSLSQSVFPTDEYGLQEGNVISEDTLNEWLSGQDKDKAPEGLNPANSNADKAEDYEPKYLNSILEYDFTQADEDDSHQLAGITIGLSMNSSDTFTTDDESETQEFQIDEATALAKGQEIAAIITERIRSNEDHDYSNIPIQFSIFYNAPEDDLGGGTFLAEAVSNSGNELGEWTQHNRDYVAFGVDEAPNGDDETAFTRFRNSVQNFFPRLSGLSGVGLYENDQLTELDITINSQFDGYTTIIALIQHTIEEANNIFVSDIPIKITIKAPSGTVAVVSREAGSSTFDYVVL